jgi:hypothetical protein
MKAARFAASVLIPLLLISCSVGRGIVPPSDIEAYEVGMAESATRVLIASQDSDFKVAVAGRLGESLRSESVYMKFIGTGQLVDEDISQYSAIVIMTACNAWDLDPRTRSFLDANPGLPNVVLLVTSGDGTWKPDFDGRKFDAVTSASVLEDAGSVAEEILEKVYAMIDRRP